MPRISIGEETPVKREIPDELMRRMLNLSSGGAKVATA